MSDAAIKTMNLTKSFGDIVAVDNLNIEVQEGALFGLVGPDGAGKTTIMRILTSIMPPSSGEAWVAGFPVLSEGESIKERIGYMSQRFGLYEDLTVMENIVFYADIYDVPLKERADRIERLLGFSNLSPFKDRLSGKLSGGMKQKLGLACALIHTPEILFLDEPTNGVDPVSRRDFWRILYDLLKEGVTIFLSTAYLDEAERCTEVGLIHHGRLLIKNSPANIKESLPVIMMEIWSSHAREVVEAVKNMNVVKGASAYGNRVHVTLERFDAVNEIIGQLKAGGAEITDYRVVVPSLEDVFVEMVK